MVVAMEVASMRATTAHRQLAAQCGLRGALGIGPGRVAAEGAHRRPVGHRRRRSTRIVLGEVAGSVDNLATDDGQIAGRVGDLVVRTCEVVTVRYDQI